MRWLCRAVLLACLTTPLWALPGDQDQPIQIEADRLQMDEVNRVSRYFGNVTIVQGSIQFEGDSIAVYFNQNDELDLLEIKGRPARFKQLNADGKPVSASARLLRYFEADARLELRGDALFRSEDDQIQSDSINLFTQNDAIEAGSPEGDSRVRMLIQPNKRTIDE